jgi:quercetin dioxygenase-like cupin family protein
MKTLIQTLLVVVLSAWLAQTVLAAEEDPVKLAPNIYKAILDNRQVRVIDVRLRPGQKTPMHEHPDYVIYALSDGKARFWDEKGQVSTMRIRAGQCIFKEDETHAVQNIGKHTIHVLNIELKGFRLF